MKGGCGAMHGGKVHVDHHPRDPSKDGRQDLLESNRARAESEREPSVTEFPRVGDECHQVPAAGMERNLQIPLT